MVTADLIHAADDLVKSDPIMSRFGTDRFRLLIFLVAWDRPHEVTYCIEQAAFNLHDFPVGLRPFDSLEAFEHWEEGNTELPDGRYFLWLNRDVRLCSVSAIDALFSPTADGHGDLSPAPLERTPATATMLRSGYLGLQFDDERRIVTRDGYCGEPLDLARSKLMWGVLACLEKRGEAWTSHDVIRRVWESHGVARMPTNGTVYDRICELNQVLHPLGLRLANARELGWRLEVVE